MEADLADLAEAIIGVGRELRLRPYPDVVELTASEAHVMRHIDHHPGVTPSELARATGLQRSNMSTALRTLENRGFVERRTDPHDARGVNLFPTRRAGRTSSGCAANGHNSCPARSAATPRTRRPRRPCSRGSRRP